MSNENHSSAMNGSNEPTSSSSSRNANSQSFASGVIFANPKKIDPTRINEMPSLHTTPISSSVTPKINSLNQNIPTTPHLTNNINNHATVAKSSQPLNVAFTPLSTVNHHSNGEVMNRQELKSQPSSQEPKRKTQSVEELKKVLSSAALSQYTKTMTLPSFSNVPQQQQQQQQGMVYPSFGPIAYPMYDSQSNNNNNNPILPTNLNPSAIQYPGYGPQATLPMSMPVPMHFASFQDGNGIATTMDYNDSAHRNFNTSQQPLESSHQEHSPRTHRRNHSRSRFRSRSPKKSRERLNSPSSSTRSSSSSSSSSSTHSSPSDSDYSENGDRDSVVLNGPKRRKNRMSVGVKQFVHKWENHSASNDENADTHTSTSSDSETSAESKSRKTQKKTSQRKATQKKVKKQLSMKHKHGKDQQAQRQNNEMEMNEEEKIMEQMTEREINLAMIAAVEGTQISFSKGFNMKTASRQQKELELHRINHIKWERKFIQRSERQMMRIIHMVSMLATLLGVDEDEMKLFKQEIQDSIEQGEYREELKILNQRVGGGSITRSSVGHLVWGPLSSFGTALMISLLPTIVVKVFKSKTEQSNEDAVRPAYNPYMPYYGNRNDNGHPGFQPPYYPPSSYPFLSQSSSNYPYYQQYSHQQQQEPYPQNHYSHPNTYPHMPPHTQHPVYNNPSTLPYQHPPRHFTNSHPSSVTQPPHVHSNPLTKNANATRPSTVNTTSNVQPASDASSQLKPQLQPSSATENLRHAGTSAPWMQASNLDNRGQFISSSSSSSYVVSDQPQPESILQDNKKHSTEPKPEVKEVCRVPVSNDNSVVDGVFSKLGPTLEMLVRLGQSDGTEGIIKNQRENNQAYNNLLKQFTTDDRKPKAKKHTKVTAKIEQID